MLLQPLPLFFSVRSLPRSGGCELSPPSLTAEERPAVVGGAEGFWPWWVGAEGIWPGWVGAEGLWPGCRGAAGFWPPPEGRLGSLPPL